jgi:hypothetical protein
MTAREFAEMTESDAWKYYVAAVEKRRESERLNLENPAVDFSEQLKDVALQGTIRGLRIATVDIPKSVLNDLRNKNK